MLCFVPEKCAVQCGTRGKSGPNFYVFGPKFLGDAPKIFVMHLIYKSPPPPTYWPSLVRLVEIPWLFFVYA